MCQVLSACLPSSPARCDLARPCGQAFLVRERHFGSLRAAEIGSFRSARRDDLLLSIEASHPAQLGFSQATTIATKWAYLTVASIRFQWSAPAALCSPASGAGSCQTNYSDRGRVQQLPPVRCSPSCAILKVQKRATRRYDRLVSCNSAQEMRGCKRRFLLSSPQAPGALPAAAPQTPGGCQQLACGARAAPGA